MADQPTVHIRAFAGRMGDPEIAGVAADTRTLCGLSRGGETVSMKHYTTHVLAFKHECCSGIWARLCPACKDYMEGVRPE